MGLKQYDLISAHCCTLTNIHIHFTTMQAEGGDAIAKLQRKITNSVPVQESIDESWLTNKIRDRLFLYCYQVIVWEWWHQHGWTFKEPLWHTTGELLKLKLKNGGIARVVKWYRSGTFSVCLETHSPQLISPSDTLKEVLCVVWVVFSDGHQIFNHIWQFTLHLWQISMNSVDEFRQLSPTSHFLTLLTNLSVTSHYLIKSILLLPNAQ